MKAIALFVVVVGAAMAAYSLSLAPYRSGSGFSSLAVSYGDSEAYADTRAAALSPKYALQDYGLTLAAVGAIAYLAVRNGRNSLQSPRHQAFMVAIALLLPILTMVAVGFDVLQAAERGEYPPWGDAVMIGLIVLPILMIPLLLWSLVHLGLFWPYGYQKDQGTRLVSALSPPRNWWLLAISAVTLALTLGFAVSGDWWMAVPGALWLYYYLSLAADRQDRSARLVRQ
jgi:hypothetical protein